MSNQNITLFHNCRIITVDRDNSIVEAMAIFKDKIIAVGAENDVRAKITSFKNKFIDKKIKIVEKNLEGTCIVPGFIDAHMHPAVYVFFKTQRDFSKVKSYSDLELLINEEKIKKCAEDWIIGINLLEEAFEDPSERYFPNRYDLDAICYDNPVLILRKDGHVCGVNSKCLKIIGIDKSNAKKITPESGEIRLDSEGEPTGIFTETATSIPLNLIPNPSSETLRNAAKDFSKELSSFGITTCGGIVQIGEFGFSGKLGTIEYPLIRTLINEGLIEQDFVFYFITDKPKKLLRIKKYFLNRIGKEEKFVFGGIKCIADGTLGAFTAFMFEPFTDSPDNKKGFMVTNKKTLNILFKESQNLGFQITCHAIGDRGNREVVNLYKNLLIKSENNNNINPLRHRIEHASVLNNVVLNDIAKLKLILVCQPAFINSEYYWLKKRLGAQRIQYTYPFRTINDAGIILAGASDSPVESANVLEAFHACVTRNGFIQEQAITVYEALKMFTYNAAYALGQENLKGSLEKGKLADFVILEHDVLNYPSEKLADIKILATYHRGQQIFTSN